MTTYIIHGQNFNGDITLVYDANGKFQSFDKGTAQLTDIQLSQWINKVSVLESEFLYRAERSNAKYTVK